MKFYRYQPINKYSIENLILKKNWASNPIHFNDPFEFPLQTDYSLGNGNKITFLNENQRENREALRSLLSRVGVISYSRSEQLLLLWSHYANCHRGMCLVFEFGEKDNIHEVKYRKTTPNLRYSNKENFQKVLITKSLEWKYEREYRELKSPSDCLHPQTGTLVEIIFGCRTPIQDIELIFKICDSNYENPIEFAKMFIQENTFHLSKNITMHKKGEGPPHYWNEKHQSGGGRKPR